MKYDTLKALTTGKVAKIAGVAPRTVSAWFDSGALKGYRLEGSLDRRIPVANLYEFLKARNMVDALARFHREYPLQERVLVASSNGLAEKLRLCLGEQFEVRGSETFADTLRSCAAETPAVVYVDFEMHEAMPLAQSLQRERAQGTQVVALVRDHADAQDATESQFFDDCFRAPFDLNLIAATLSRHLSKSK